MRITIDWSEVKTTSTGKDYKKVVATDEQGNKVEASAWSDAPFYAEIAPGATIEAEVKKSPDGKYTNLVGALQKRTAPSTYKTAQIEQAQARKEKSIAMAQDRSAWMWAKTSACTLVANHPSYKYLGTNEIEDVIEDLATKIYNFEPLTPFNG